MKKIFVAIFLFLSLIMIVSPRPAEAFSLVYTCTGSTLGANGALPNGERQCDFDDFINAINSLITDAFILAAPLAVIAFTWAGVKLVLAQGNAGKIQEAKRIFWSVGIGFIFICVAWLIVFFIVQSLGCTACQQFLGGNANDTNNGSNLQNSNS